MVDAAPTSGARAAVAAVAAVAAIAVIAAGVVIVALAAGAAEAAPRGKVVRVERVPAAEPPRMCKMVGANRQLLCFGHPRPGERIVLFDPSEQTVSGELVIETVGEASPLLDRALCASAGFHGVKGSYVSGADGGDHLIGVRGLKVDRRAARLMESWPAPRRGAESVELAVDADGDQRADLLVTRYSCDAGGAIAPDGAATCFDTHVLQRGTLRRVQQDILQACR